MTEGERLASVQAEHLNKHPALRCEDPHETTVMIAANCGQWLSRVELWQAVQAFEPLSLRRVDMLRKSLMTTDRIISTRLGNSTYYVGTVVSA